MQSAPTANDFRDAIRPSTRDEAMTGVNRAVIRRDANLPARGLEPCASSREPVAAGPCRRWRSVRQHAADDPLVGSGAVSANIRAEPTTRWVHAVLLLMPAAWSVLVAALRARAGATAHHYLMASGATIGSAFGFVAGMSVARCTVGPSGVCLDWGAFRWLLPVLIVAVGAAAAFGFAPLGTLIGRRLARRF